MDRPAERLEQLVLQSQDCDCGIRGAPVKTLLMPVSANVFIGLMVAGMMLALGQLVGYGIAAGAAGDAITFASWSAWLGPLREVALGILLSSIVLA